MIYHANLFLFSTQWIFTVRRVSNLVDNTLSRVSFGFLILRGNWIWDFPFGWGLRSPNTTNCLGHMLVPGSNWWRKFWLANDLIDCGLPPPFVTTGICVPQGPTKPVTLPPPPSHFTPRRALEPLTVSCCDPLDFPLFPLRWLYFDSLLWRAVVWGFLWR